MLGDRLHERRTAPRDNEVNIAILLEQDRHKFPIRTIDKTDGARGNTGLLRSLGVRQAVFE
jgi:hypothetical protein